MTDNPLNDPEVAEFMRQHGIVHKPGMAQELMGELAPLLAAEGIDINDPDGAPSLEELNAALGRAVEQRNMTLMNPVNQDRDLTVAFIVEFTELLAAGRVREAEQAAESIEPEATATRPPASHVIGVSLGLLDTLHTDAVTGPALTDVEIPKWRGPAKSTARRILAHARHGEAYGSLTSLLRQHGGEFVMHSALLAIAGTLITHAQNEGVPVAEAATILGSGDGGRKSSGAAFGLGASFESSSQRAYTAWLTSDPENDPDEIRVAVAAFGALERLATIEEIDISKPNGIVPLIDALHSHPDTDIVYSLLNHLDRYIHFRMEAQETGWDRAHDAVSEALDDLHPEFTIISDAIAISRETPQDERLDALRSTRALAAAPRMLEWIGTSRPVTQTGNLRRSDIAPAARLLDLYVEGVAKLPPPTRGASGLPAGYDPAEPRYVQSALQAPLLAALWETFLSQRVLRVNTSSVRPGPRRDEVFGASATDEAVELFAASLVMEIITRPFQQDEFYFIQYTHATIETLLIAIESQVEGVPAAGEGPRLHFLLWELAHAGFITLDGDGISIPPALLGTVALGVMMAIEYLATDG